MSRNNRSIAGFGKVANVNNKDNINPNDNINNDNVGNVKDSQAVNESENVNTNININDNDNDKDIFDKILSENENKEKTHVLKGIYFERDVAKAIDKVTKGKGKGAKSELVNAAVKEAFKRKGWL